MRRPRTLRPILPAIPVVLAAGLVAVGAIPRLLLAADALPGALRPFVWSDVLFTWERGLAGGRLPYWDTSFEYPPLVGYASALFSALAPSAVVYVALWTVVQAIAAAAIAVVLVQAGADRRAIWAWSAAPQLPLLAPINFDVLAVLALVLAVRWERAGTTARSVGALAAGTAAKLFPAVALPVVLLRRPAAGTPIVLARLALFGALVAACYAPAAAAPFSSLEGLGRYSVGIEANFDSFWGVIAGGLQGAGIDAAAPLLVVTTAGLALTYLLVVLPAATRARDVALPIALAVLTLLLWSRLYSPQFSLWALPFFALLPLPGRALGLLIAADLAVFLTVYPLTLREWSADDPVRAMLLGVLAAAVVVRHVALALAWFAARRLVCG